MSFRGEGRTNEIDRSLTDPDARLARKSKSQESRLAHGLHMLMKNKNGLAMDFAATEANGTAERHQALWMVCRAKGRHDLRPLTLAAGKGYDAGPTLHALEVEGGVVPLVPIRRDASWSRTPAAEARRRAHPRTRTKQYRTAQQTRKRVQKIYSWSETIGGLRRSHHVGRWKSEQLGLVVCAAYNLLRLTRLSRERGG